MFRSCCSLLVVLAAASGLSGCTTAQPLAMTPSPEVGSAPGMALEGKSSASISRIVFIGKKNACDCTRSAIEATSRVIDARLGPSPSIVVERLEIDVDSDGVREYQKMRPMLALPALYFLDGEGRLVQMLQGEVSEAQLSSVLP